MPTFALVTPYLPAPDNTGGRIRMHRLATALAQHGPVDLYARVYPVERAPEAGDSTTALSVYRTIVARGGDLGCVLPWFESKRVRHACPRSLRAALESAHASKPYSAVVVCHAYAWATAARLRGTVRVLDEHNIESEYLRAVDSNNAREAGLMNRWERRAWRAADLVSVCTEHDAKVVRGTREGLVAVVPNGTDLRAIPFILPSQRNGHEVLFVGAMSHAPNVRAAVELVRDVLPLLLRTHPDARVTLCGRAPSRDVLALAGEAVTVTGTVPSVRDFLSRASAYANLVRDGAGSSLKVPEALAAGLPLVSTSTGVRGFSLTNGQEVQIAERPDSIAHAIADAWTDRARADVMAHHGRAFAATHDWAAVGEGFARQVLQAIEGVAT